MNFFFLNIKYKIYRCIKYTFLNRLYNITRLIASLISANDKGKAPYRNMGLFYWVKFMSPSQYKQLTKKSEIKKKPRIRPLPKAKEAYLEAFEDFEQSLNVLKIKYGKLFQFESTKHWRFDFHLIEQRILVEISGGPWSGGRKGKLKDKAWSMDRYDVAADMGYTVIRIESAPRYKIQEDGPLQVEANFSSQWLKNLKRHIFNGTDQTISTDRTD